MKTDIFVSVVLPGHNIGSCLVVAVSEVLAVLQKTFTYYEVIIVDDGSTDEPGNLLASILQQHEGVRIIRLAREHGLDIAISAGLDSSVGDVVAVLDPRQDPPDLLPGLIQRCCEKHAVLYGVAQRGVHRFWLRQIIAGLFAAYCRRWLGVDIQRHATVYRIMPRSVVNAITQLNDRTRLVRLMIAIAGYPVEPFVYVPQRQKDVFLSGSNFWDDVDAAFDILVAISRHPLRWLSRVAISVAGLNALYALYVVAVYFLKSRVVEGWATMSLQITGMFFFLFILLAVLCEYVGKMMMELRGGSRYAVLDEKNSSVLVDASRRRNIVTESTHT